MAHRPSAFLCEICPVKHSDYVLTQAVCFSCSEAFSLSCPQQKHSPELAAAGSGEPAS